MSGFYLDEQYETILADNDVSVRYCDTVVDGNGKESPHPFGHTWQVSWRQGFIGLGPIEDEITARKAAAIFVALWLKEIPTEFCVERARDFAYIETLELKLQKAQDELDDIKRNEWLARDIEKGC